MAHPLLPAEGMQQEQCLPGMTMFEGQGHCLHTRLSCRTSAHHPLPLACSSLLLLLAGLRSQHKKLVVGTTELLKQWELAALSSFKLLQLTAPVTKPRSSLVGRSKAWAKKKKEQRQRLWAWASQAALALQTLERALLTVDKLFVSCMLCITFFWRHTVDGVSNKDEALLLVESCMSHTTDGNHYWHICDKHFEISLGQQHN